MDAKQEWTSKDGSHAEGSTPKISRKEAIELLESLRTAITAVGAKMELVADALGKKRGEPIAAQRYRLGGMKDDVDLVYYRTKEETW